MKGLEHVTEGLVVRPGEVLVLRCKTRLTLAEFDNLRETVREQLPDSVKCLIVDDTIEIAKVET